jgi:chaperonin GroES
MNDSTIVACRVDTVKPLGDRVLIKPDAVEEKTAGWIYVPDTAKTRTQRGTVVEIGPDVASLRVGDRVIFTYWSAVHLDLNGVEHFLYAAKDILGVLIQEASDDDHR